MTRTDPMGATDAMTPKPGPATPAQRKRALVTAVLLAAFAVVVYVTVMLQIAAR